LSLRRDLERVRSLPPRRSLARGAGRIGRSLKRRWRKGTALLLGTGISDGQFRAALCPGLGDEAALLEFLRSGDAPAFFVTPGNAGAIVAGLERHCPDAAARSAAAADQACAHVFDLLGSGPTALGPAIDWHADFKSGHRYDPRAHHTDLSPAPYPGGHDIKVPWELSRCQHFVWLGQAYWHTGDEKYPREFVGQVTDWIEANPPAFGVNWVCAMDVAIRAVNWLWGYHYFVGRSPALTDEFLLRFDKSLLAHGRHIIGNLERSAGLASNHYLSDLVGLVYLGLMCPQFREARKWREVGLRELWREMRRQVHADGVDFEASISYHRLVAELFLSAILLGRLHGVTVPADVMARLEKMIELVLHYTRPDGTVPLFGDCDNGRLHRLMVRGTPEREWTDHRYLLAIGAVLFQRDDLGRVAGDQWEEALWLMGERAIRFKESLEGKPLPAEPESRLFPDGGLCFMRGGGAYVAVDAGANGQGGVGGHAHNDALSFEFAFGGRPWVIDPGTFVYTADYDARNRFRSSRVHDVLMIDGQELNRFDRRELFVMQEDARPVVHAWDPTPERDLLIGSHHGYERLDPPVFVRRVLWFEKPGGELLVMDEVRAAGRHTLACNLHLAHAVIEIDGRVAWIESPGSEWRLAVCVVSSAARVDLAASTGWISAGYGSRSPTPVLSVGGEFDDRLSLACVLVPYRSPGRMSAEDVSGMAERLVARCCRDGRVAASLEGLAPAPGPVRGARGEARRGGASS
jgi:hypothetical protein